MGKGTNECLRRQQLKKQTGEEQVRRGLGDGSHKATILGQGGGEVRIELHQLDVIRSKASLKQEERAERVTLTFN